LEVVVEVGVLASGALEDFAAFAFGPFPAGLGAKFTALIVARRWCGGSAIGRRRGDCIVLAEIHIRIRRLFLSL